jgi:hypothetical protein
VPFALFVVGLALFLVSLVIVVFDFMRTMSNEMFGASTVVAYPLLPISKLPLHYLVALLFEPLLISSQKESNIFHFLILFTITFIFT